MEKLNIYIEMGFTLEEARERVEKFTDLDKERDMVCICPKCKKRGLFLGHSGEYSESPMGEPWIECFYCDYHDEYVKQEYYLLNHYDDSDDIAYFQCRREDVV